MTRLGRPNAGLKARTTRTLRQPCFRPSRTAATFVLAVGVSPRLNANLERSRGAAVSTWFPVEGRGFSRAKTCAREIGLSAPAPIPWLKAIPPAALVRWAEAQRFHRFLRSNSWDARLGTACPDRSVLCPVGQAGAIGIGAAVTRRPLPHHRAYGSVHGGSSWLR